MLLRLADFPPVLIQSTGDHQEPTVFQINRTYSLFTEFLIFTFTSACNFTCQLKLFIACEKLYRISGVILYTAILNCLQNSGHLTDHHPTMN